jgi:hypothetical protein
LWTIRLIIGEKTWENNWKGSKSVTKYTRTKWKNKEGKMLLLCFKFVNQKTIID